MMNKDEMKYLHKAKFLAFWREKLLALFGNGKFYQSKYINIRVAKIKLFELRNNFAFDLTTTTTNMYYNFKYSTFTQLNLMSYYSMTRYRHSLSQLIT